MPDFEGEAEALVGYCLPKEVWDSSSMLFDPPSTLPWVAVDLNEEIEETSATRHQRPGTII